MKTLIKKFGILLSILLSTLFVAAQPPDWPDVPPLGTPENLDISGLETPETQWETINSSGCEINFSTWFVVDENNGGNHTIHYIHMEYTLGSNSSGYATTDDIFKPYFGTGWQTNGKTYTVIGTAAYISVAGSAFTAIIPPGCWTKVHIQGNSAPCECVYYCFDLSNAYHPTLTINPVNAPDTCP